MRDIMNRWFAKRAFGALNWVMDTGNLSYSEYNHCVRTLDILRSNMYKDYVK